MGPPIATAANKIQTAISVRLTTIDSGQIFLSIIKMQAITDGIPMMLNRKAGIKPSRSGPEHFLERQYSSGHAIRKQ
jgi:hypothetical protein